MDKRSVYVITEKHNNKHTGHDVFVSFERLKAQFPPHFKWIEVTPDLTWLGCDSNGWTVEVRKIPLNEEIDVPVNMVWK